MAKKPTRKAPVRRRRRNPARVSNPAPRRRRRRTNPGLPPWAMGLLGGATGLVVGAGASMALGYVDWNHYYKCLALGGGGALIGVPLSFYSPSFGAGIIAGTGSIAVSAALMTYLASSSTSKAPTALAASAQSDADERPLSAVRAPRSSRQLPAVQRVGRDEKEQLRALAAVFATLDPDQAMGLVFADTGNY
ncbi:MAG TPA: hypothetical protein VM118_04215 [Acidobacteriota bacterium]|nr:hypothetical protein [Acidobacteriota bacterium]